MKSETHSIIKTFFPLNVKLTKLWTCLIMFFCFYIIFFFRMYNNICDVNESIFFIPSKCAILQKSGSNTVSFIYILLIIIKYKKQNIDVYQKLFFNFCNLIKEIFATLIKLFFFRLITHLTRLSLRRRIFLNTTRLIENYAIVANVFILHAYRNALTQTNIE